ncbi:cysteine-rich with EGF-like domain protein 2-A, partial [Saccoglossus kowalevskii]
NNTCSNGTQCINATCYANNNGTEEKCMCWKGYKHDDNNDTVCVPINECTTDIDAYIEYCDDDCVDITPGYDCTCHYGYLLNDDLRTCSDLDECETGTHNCSQESELCVNEIGDFQCICSDGYLNTSTGCK